MSRPITRRAALVGLLGAATAACGAAPLAVVTPTADPTSTPPTGDPTTAATSTTTATPTAAPTGATTAQAVAAHAALPAGVLAGYWPTWVPDAVRIRDLPAAYGMVHLFAAVPAGTDGTLTWDPPGDGRGAATNLRADLTAGGRTVLLSVGGAGHGLSFGSRAVSSRFVDSVRRIVDEQLGGSDGVSGVDLNTFEADAVPDTAEYAWVAQRLKAAYGDGFLVTAPPAPWRDTDEVFCRDLARDGLLDLCGPQFYDGPGLTDQDYIVERCAHWADLVGPRRLYVGFGVVDAPNYLTAAQCAAAFRAVRAAVPDVRGAFCWNTSADEATGWAFAAAVGPLVNG